MANLSMSYYLSLFMYPDYRSDFSQLEKLFPQQDYQTIITLCEEQISHHPDLNAYYWYLGLALLLKGQEAEAQMAWMQPLLEVEGGEGMEAYAQELIQVLQVEAERRESIADFPVAWLIRQHIREINPEYLDNLLVLVYLAIQLDKFTLDDLSDWGVISLLESEPKLSCSTDALLVLLKEILGIAPFHPVSFAFTKAALTNFNHFDDCFNVLLPAVMHIGHTYKNPEIAASYLDLYLQHQPDNLEALRHLTGFYQDNHDYANGISKARLCYSLSKTPVDRIFALHLLLRGLMGAGGYYEEVKSTCQELESALQEFIKSQPILLDETSNCRIITPSFAIPHIQDNPAKFREIHNQIAAIFQDNMRRIAGEKVSLDISRQSTPTANQSIQQRKYFPTQLKTNKLKIGYLSYALRQHAVGYLTRFLYQYHQRKDFEIYTYFVNYNQVDDWMQDYYEQQSTHARKLGMNAFEVAAAISEDEIDILVDLDSITLDISAEVMALKPAPIQATWLGWDASGIPAIDYFIADPYVLPESASSYYQEKIWRLPQTYIAVDGFEVGIPTLRREDLDIPDDAVIYLSAQRGYKRHPETTKWQMQIIKEVPNSYFLIKGFAEEEAIKRFFYKIAEEEGVDRSRLRFLPEVALESVHRANLRIADIVLDTYPYNGATTTLETLWMGIPLVTRVGEQFAARNSYTMMINAGITEGIAWTDAEYIEWGIRLGKDEKLRQDVAWKLQKSKQTAPLWNGKRFTREMENAYRQMWGIYCQSVE